jgi:hypothetical protein
VELDMILQFDPNKLAALASSQGDEIATVDAAEAHANKKPKTKYVPKPKKPTETVEAPEERKPDPSKYGWTAELGWELDANGKFNYSPGGSAKADPETVPDGCHEYAHVDLCFNPSQGDAWVLRKTRNMQLSELQCVGYLCNHYKNEKCCTAIQSVKAVIDGKNWYDLAEYEDNFGKMMKATGQYLP